MKEKAKSKKQQILSNSRELVRPPSLSNIIPTMGQTVVLLGLFTAPAGAFNLVPIGRYSTGIFNQSAAEIVTYDKVGKNVFSTNVAQGTIDVLNISNPSNPTLTSQINVANSGVSVGRLNSVAYQNGFLAAAVENADPNLQGSVLLYNSSGTLLKTLTVGYQPDMVTFTPDGRILVANEGEPSPDYTVDQVGSVSIIDTLNNFNVTTVGFAGVNTGGSGLITGPTISNDPNISNLEINLEPEYITVSNNSQKAWVTLQENNAVAILDLEKGVFEQVVGLGYKDHSQPENALDASDRDDAINITTYNNLFGLYQPDAVAAYTYLDQTYLVTANEGDPRVYPNEDRPDLGLEEGEAYNEEVRVEDVVLDPTAFPNAEELQQEENLGRLVVTNTLGDTDGDGDFDELYAFGGALFSIWDSQGNLIFDSGKAFEEITAEFFPEYFNSNEAENDTFDNRSDNRGPEPEGLTIGQFGDQTLAFIALERIGSIITYDITNPNNPVFLDYVNPRNFLGDPEAGTAGDLSPEGLFWISAEDSPNGKPLLVAANVVSGTTTIYQAVPEPSIMLGALGSSIFLFGNKFRKKK